MILQKLMMNFRLFHIVVLFVFLSCKKEERKVVQSVPDSTKTDTVQMVRLEKESEPFDPIQQEKHLFKSLLPSTYRTWENENPVSDLNSNWTEIYKKDQLYFSDKTKFKLENGYDACSGDSTKTIITPRKTLILMDFQALVNGKIKSVPIHKDKIWPGEKISFNFNGINYQLRAEGDVLQSENVYSDDGETILKVVENYRLFISSDEKPEQLFLEESSFNDTFVELKLIGDIDGDSKPDFIFQANRHYEEERVVVFLSSQAHGKEIIKKISEDSRQFDC